MKTDDCDDVHSAVDKHAANERKRERVCARVHVTSSESESVLLQFLCP